MSKECRMGASLSSIKLTARPLSLSVSTHHVWAIFYDHMAFVLDLQHSKLEWSFIEAEMSLKLQFKLRKTITHEWNNRQWYPAHTSTHLHTRAVHTLNLLPHRTASVYCEWAALEGKIHMCVSLYLWRHGCACTSDKSILLKSESQRNIQYDWWHSLCRWLW